MDEIFIFPPKFYVMNPTTSNYSDLFELAANLWVPFSRYIFNSFFVAIVATALHVLLSSMAAYPLAKLDFPGKRAIFEVVVTALMFVPQVTFVAQYIIIAKLHLLNTYGALIYPAIGASLGIFLMKQFMENIPYDLIESARIDGAGEYRIFFRIVFPNTRPAWLTLIIFTFQGIWNNGGGQFIYSEKLKMLPNIISQIVAGNTMARMGVSMAATVFIMIPPIVLFVGLQSRVMETMTYAGIKG